MGPYLDNIFFLRNPVDANIHKAADDDSEEKYDYVKKYCPEHSLFVPLVNYIVFCVTVGLVGKIGSMVHEPYGVVVLIIAPELSTPVHFTVQVVVVELYSNVIVIAVDVLVYAVD